MIGSDPEFVLVENGIARNALSVLGAKKNVPIGYSTMFADNVLVEFNIPPTYDALTMREYLMDAFTHAARRLYPMTLEARASEVFTDGEMNHPDSYIFGCRPELSAWNIRNGQATPVDSPHPDGNLRTCGGHIHVELDGGSIPRYVRAMDLFVGIPSVFLNQDPTKVRRHQMYGGSGRFRVTDYGFEYRTLSNFWLARPELVEVVIGLVRYALAHAGTVPADVIDVIDNQDADGALQIYRNCVEAAIPGSLRSRITRAVDLPLGSLFQNWGVA